MKELLKVDKDVLIVGIIGLVILECVALWNGVNGTVFTFVIAIIGAAIGVTIPTPKALVKNG